MEGVVGWTTLAPLGNDLTHFNVERRKSLLKNDLKPLAEADFPDQGSHLFLFGEDFGKRARTMADKEGAQISIPIVFQVTSTQDHLRRQVV